jgi:hypothetical protein
MKPYTLVLLILASASVCSQNDSITYNQLDEKGKKNGYWICQVDSQLCKTESADYAFQVYEFYDHGNPVLSFSCDKYERKFSSYFFPDSLYNAADKLISGTVYTYNPNGIIYSAINYVAGIQTYMCVNYTMQEGYYFEAFFTEKWNNQPYSAKAIYSEPYYTDRQAWYGNGPRGWHHYYIQDSLNPIKYPYFKNETPPLIGLLLGYNFIQSRELILGVMWNTSINNGLKTGMMSGPSLNYAYNLDNKIHRFDLDLGLYSPISAGIGANYTFSGSQRIFGFKPFIGTTFYHVQLLYGYNFFGKKNNDIMQIAHHHLQLRAVIPLRRLINYTEN